MPDQNKIEQSEWDRLFIDKLKKQGAACAKCKYWGAKLGTYNLEGQSEKCRKNAPSAGKKSFPETMADDWCGEFRPHRKEIFPEKR